MKKILIAFLLLSLISIFYLFPSKDNNTVKIAEVTHSIFYAPQYVAISKGYFKDEGIDVELILTPGADKVTAAVLSGDVDIGLCGPEATIYVYNSNEEDYIKSFAQLTTKDGSFIVSREKIDNFSLNDLIGKTVIAGRNGGMPAMTFNYILKENNINSNDINIDTSISFSSMEGVFISGYGDFVNLFEPNASNVVKEGYGYIVSSLGELSGDTIYTAYNARKSFIENNEDIIKGFRNAINKALKYVNETDEKTIAKDIYEYFPDMSLNELENSIKQYKNLNTWKMDTNISEEAFKKLEDIMIYNGVLDNYIDYNKLVINE